MLHCPCLERVTLAYLPRYPKSKAGKDLKNIVLDLHKISNHEERAQWVRWHRNWEAEYHDFLNEQAELLSDKRLYKHFSIRQAKAQIGNTLSHPFHALDDPKIPKFNNGLGCRFSYLKKQPPNSSGVVERARNIFSALV